MPKKHKYISRFEFGHTIGYSVRVPNFKNGLALPYKDGHDHAFFAKRKYKTWKSALLAAMTWRDAYLKKHKGLYVLDENPRINRAMDETGRNTSGAIGVILSVTTKRNSYIESYRACWCEDKKQYTKTFACLLYGQESAFLMACRVRFKHSGTIIIKNEYEIPCLPDVEYRIE